jgi:hypothetical protein
MLYTNGLNKFWREKMKARERDEQLRIATIIIASIGFVLFSAIALAFGVL